MKTNTVNFDKGNKEKHVSNDKMLCNHNYRTKLKFLNAVYNYVHLEILMKLVFPRKKKSTTQKSSNGRNQKFVQNYLQEDHRPESTISVLSNYKVTNHFHAS